MTCYMDWRTEPETDVAEEVVTYTMLGQYRIVCLVDECDWEEVLKDPDYSNSKYSDDDVEEIRQEHITWHREGCPE